MYSYEIKDILKKQNYIINSNTYKKILDTSKQINYIKYNPYDGSTYLSTSDGCSWSFKIIN